MSKLIIAGSRSINDYDTVAEIIESFIRDSRIAITEVVCGCARGVDTLGGAWADNHGIPVIHFPADWDDLDAPGAVAGITRWGKPYNVVAGKQRNSRMVEYGDILLLIHDGVSTGSLDTLEKAEKRGIPRHVVTVDVEQIKSKKSEESKLRVIEWAREMHEKRALVVDTEFTSMDSGGEIIALGVVESCTGKVLMDTLIQPHPIDKIKFNPYATKVHGITKTRLLREPRFTDIYSELRDLLDGRDIIAYNKSADERMINQTIRKYSLTELDSRWHCLMQNYKIYSQNSKVVKLSKACEEVGAKGGNHNAVEDALATARLLWRIANDGTGGDSL